MTLAFNRQPAGDRGHTTTVPPLNELVGDMVYLVFSTTSEELWSSIKKGGLLPSIIPPEATSRWRIDELDADRAALMMIELCRDAAWNKYANAMDEIDGETDFIAQNAKKFVADRLYRDDFEIADALYQAVLVVPGLMGDESAAAALADFEIRHGNVLRHLAARARTARGHG